jgi:hypothetical protein
MDGLGSRLTWTVRHQGTTLSWGIDPTRLRFRIGLLRETAGPQADGLLNHIHRFAHHLADGFAAAAGGSVLPGPAGDLLLAVAVGRHPHWFEDGAAPTLHFAIDPDTPLAVAPLAPGSIAIERA